MNCNQFLLPQHGRTFPLSEILEAIANFAAFTPDTRQAAVRLLEAEYGLFPREFWAIAAIYLDSQEVAQ